MHLRRLAFTLIKLRFARLISQVHVQSNGQTKSQVTQKTCNKLATPFGQHLRPCSDLMPVPVHGARGTKMDVVHTRQWPELYMFINNYGKVITIEKSAEQLEL